MVTIGRIASLVNSFFRPQQRFFSKPVGPHFGGLVTGMAVGPEHTVGRLASPNAQGTIQAWQAPAEHGFKRSARLTPYRSWIRLTN